MCLPLSMQEVTEQIHRLVLAVLEKDATTCEACLNKLTPSEYARDGTSNIIFALEREKGLSSERDDAVDEAFEKLVHTNPRLVRTGCLKPGSNSLLTVAMRRFPEMVKSRAAVLLSQQKNSGCSDAAIKTRQAYNLIDGLVKSCPKSAQDVFVHVLRSPHGQLPKVKEEIVRRLGQLLTCDCPEGAASAIECIVALSRYGGHSPANVRIEAIRQMVNYASTHPRNIYTVLKRLHDACGDELNISVRREVISKLPQLIKISPKHARDFVCMLFWCCGEKQGTVSNTAKNLLEEGLKACPEVAIEILEGFEATREAQEGTSLSRSVGARKRSIYAVEELRPAQRRRMDEREMTLGPSGSVVSQFAEQQRKLPRNRPEESEEESRPAQRRKTSKDDVNVASGHTSGPQSSRN